MFSEGYRPTTGGHAVVVEFLRIRLGSPFTEMVQTMDRMRRQRHRITYDAPGVVSPSQIREAVRTAEDSSRNSRGYSLASKKKKGRSPGLSPPVRFRLVAGARYVRAVHLQPIEIPVA